MNPITPPASFQMSRFWKRIKKARKSAEYVPEHQAIEGLTSSLPTIVKSALDLSDMVHLRMTQYTDHRRTHLLNVLGIMDALVPDEAMHRLHPLECALCILTAFTHDLGMVMGADELERLRKDDPDDPEAVRFREYRAGFADEVRRIERLEAYAGGASPDAKTARRRIDEIEEYILADYLREHHTSLDANRIDAWLQKIERVAGRPLFLYGAPDHSPYDYRYDLSLIGLSHGYAPDWLRLKLQDRRDFPLAVGSQGHVNLAYPGLLLRLADVMDFDASRAPRILFQSLGISDEVSLREWRKHLAITGWQFDPSKTPALRYRATQCPSPVVHKSILSFVDAIRDEGYRTDGEAEAQRHELSRGEDTREIADRYQIHALGNVAADVRPVKNNGRPLYLYSDIQFRLDQDEVLGLLMGESLYGDPSLCLRELIQNALDALQLRDLRWQLVQSGQTPAEPVDPVTIADPLRVEVSWGTEGDDTVIRVRDNGVGMTRDVIERYFTQIGKSFYRSAAFEREKALLKQSGKLATPISHFGIGILSCFMIADRLRVRTNPGHAGQPGRERYDVNISGPGSLFWMTDGTLGTQGTEITLFLKPDVVIKDGARGALIERLRYAFDYGPRTEIVAAHERATWERQADPTRYIDPAYTIGCYVVWPTYPVHLASLAYSARYESGQPALVIDDTFHLRDLAPLDAEATVAKAAEWNVAPEAVGTPHWHLWDFVDEGETGSRIRIWTPLGDAGDAPFEDPPTTSGRIRHDDLGSYVETTLEASNRNALLVKGMHVPDVSEASGAVEWAAGIGTRVWIDLRGDASPVLLASRAAVRRHPHPEAWSEAVRGVFARAFAWALHEADPASKGRNLRLGVLSRWSALPLPPLESDPWFSTNQYTRLLQETAFTHDLDRDDDLYHGLDRDRALAFSRGLNRALNRANSHADSLYLAFDRASSHAYSLYHALDRDRDVDRELARDLTRDLDRYRDLMRDLDHDLDRAFLSVASVAQEQFFPSLEQSFPRLHRYHLVGQVSAARLRAPAVPDFQTGADGRTVVPYAEGLDPAALPRLDGYDLVFPLTAVPLGPLRRDCPLWSAGRRAFRLGTAPFQFPELHDVWLKHAKMLHEWLGVAALHALLPPQALWETPFENWTDADWTSCETAHWDVTTGKILWADGVVPRDEIRERGRPTPERFPEVARRDA